MNRLMNIYLIGDDKKVSSKSESHQLLCNKIVNYLKADDKLKKYYIKGSDGNGQRTYYPWICLMDSNITRTPQKGLYLAILFKRNMEGFYVTLTQGITFFDRLYKSKKFDRAEEAAGYFRKEMASNDFLPSISIGGQKPDNGYGFEKTTICGQYFKKNDFTDKELMKSLGDLSSIYDEILEILGNRTYEEVLPKIVGDSSLQFDSAEKAIESINKIINEGTTPVHHLPIEVKPKIDEPKRFREISTPSNSKIDYVKRAAKNAEIGLLGEKLMLEFEIDRLNRLGLDKYASKVKHSSLQNDVLGYDIQSYDVDDKGRVHEIFIEVKTSSTSKDVDFFVSKNEVLKSKEYKEKYWIYRVYNCSPQIESPKFYRVKGTIEDSFSLTPDTYKASLKRDARIINSETAINANIVNRVYKKL